MLLNDDFPCAFVQLSFVKYIILCLQKKNVGSNLTAYARTFHALALINP